MQTQHSEAHTQGILVVEDDETIREVVSAMLKSLGYAVTSSRSADEALELCKSKRFDLVLVDMVMPHMHGLALIDELHRQRPSLPTILMTGSNIVPNDERARAVRVINKPFDIETLARAVEQSLVSLGAGGISATIH